MRRSHPRFFAALAALVPWGVVMSQLACSRFEGDDTTPLTPASSNDGSAGDVEEGVPRVGVDPAKDASTPVRVSGSLVQYSSDYEPNSTPRKVVLVDATGVRQEVMSTSDGRFTFSGVQSPYDLSVLTSTTPRSMWLVMLGISSQSPKLAVLTPYIPVTSAKATLSMTIQVPPCLEASCNVRTVSGSAHRGLGFDNRDYLPGATSVSFPLEHAWRDSGTPEKITIHALVASGTRNAFWHAETATILSPGGASSFNIAPTSVPILGTFTATAQDAAFTSEWTRRLTVGMALPGVGYGFEIRGAASASLVAKVPDIAGATIGAEATLSMPTSPQTPPADRVNREATSRKLSLPISTPSTTLTFVAPAENVQPAPKGVLHAKDGSVSWQAATKGMAGVNIQSANIYVDTYTNESKVDVKRLYKLGIAELAIGDHELYLATFPPAFVLDDLAAAPATLRDITNGQVDARTSLYYGIVVAP